MLFSELIINEKACEHLKENGVDVIEENSLL